MKVQLSDNKSIDISVVELVNEIYEHSKYLRDNFKPQDLEEYGSDFIGVDSRLQVYDGWWALRTGSSDYDTDHRGYWSSSSIPYRCTREQSRVIARELIEGLE
jgi:hypothetical protein